MAAVEVSLRAALLVAAGGAAGCVLRYVVGAWLTRPDYPWGTLAVNLVGSFIVALVMFWGLANGGLAPGMRLFLVTGVLAGFTTMSSFAYETLALAEGAEAWRAVGYVLVTVIGSLAMAVGGRAVAHALA